MNYAIEIGDVKALTKSTAVIGLEQLRKQMP